jgi:hypothetical protein
LPFTEQIISFLGLQMEQAANLHCACRWYATPTLRPDSTILIHGGTTAGKEDGMAAKEYEVWDPKQPELFPMPKYPVDEDYLTTTQQASCCACCILCTLHPVSS